MNSFSIFHWLIVIGIVFVVYKSLRGLVGQGGKVSENGTMICPNCCTQGGPKTVTKGSMGIEIVLWLCLIIPELIYSIWRLTTRHPACPSCGQPGMIGIGTPNGRALVEKLRA